MYIPGAFRETRFEILSELMSENGFATLVTQMDGELTATHLPLLLERNRGAPGRLVGHMARANPQWRSFRSDQEALVIFQGPHAYISPRWYETGPAVPTWDYAAIHVYGSPTLVTDGQELRGLLETMVGRYDRSAPDIPEDFLVQMMKGIVGFEIAISRIEGKLKLSQNRSEADRRGVVEGLLNTGSPGDALLAAMMDRMDE